MKKNRKVGLLILPLVVIGILLLILFQPENNEFDSNLPESTMPDSSLERSYGTVYASLGSPTLGSPSAPVTIMAFIDYQCTGCKGWYENIFPAIMKNLIEAEKANLVFIEAEQIGADSLLSSQATYCANDQGKYFDYQGLLYSSQREIDDGWASPENLKAFASDLGIDREMFQNCLDTGKYEKKVRFNIDETKKNGIVKVPTFVIISADGRHHMIKGVGSYLVFEEITDSFIE